jgi:hypothetical protein
VGGLFALGHPNVCVVVPDLTIAVSISSPTAPSIA